MCPNCQSLEWSPIEASGLATVISFVMPRHPPMPMFDDDYIVALVELDEGIRLVTNLVGVTPSDTTIGMQVTVRFEHHDNDVVLAVFTPSAQVAQ